MNSVVFIGHVDSGKSTLCGQILYLTGQVPDRVIESYKKIAAETGMTDWWMSYVMDTDDAERANGKTVEVAKATFTTGKRTFECIDTPGHKKYITNMISGACCADIAIILVSAKAGEFEAGITGGQTREHILLAKTLGIDIIIIAVNKMDTCALDCTSDRFDYIQKELSPILRMSGYKPKIDVVWVPMSAYSGKGVVDAYPGYSVSLFQALDTVHIPEPDVNGSAVLLCCDQYKDNGYLVVNCKVISGTVSPGDTLLSMPDNTELQVHNTSENVNLKVMFKTDAIRGDILCQANAQQPNVSNVIDVLLIIQPMSGVITVGYTCILHMYTVSTPVIVKRVSSVTDVRGQVVTRKYILPGDRVRVYLELPKKLVVFNETENARLSRITLRSNTDTVAIGKIIRYTRS